MKTLKIFIAILFLSLVSCKSEKVEEETAKGACCAKKDSKTEECLKVSDQSLFNISSKWITQNKDSISFSNFKGKITIIAMVFTHCESACPRIVADMKRVEKEFTKEELNELNFLLISMDPERDTPDRFLEFAKENQINSDWSMISSDENATMEMANLLGVRVKKLSNGGFDHSNTIHVLNREGEILFQQNGLQTDPKETISKIKSNLK